MSNHTPTPWVVRQSGDKATIEQDKDRVHPQSFEVGFSSRDPLIVRTVIAHCTEPTFGEGEANAAFIVRACNSHAALVEALKECLECEFHVTGKSTIAKAEAALALAHTAQGGV